MATETVLPPDPASARSARRFVADTLAATGVDAPVDVATLLVSELVTNALLHARSEIVVRVQSDDGRVRVEVDDRSAAPPVLRARRDDATTGRGTVLVDALAASWGVEADGAGKTVWFELPSQE